MLQPFERLLPMYLPKLQALNKRYLVTQTYHLINHFADPASIIPIILSVYDDAGLAKTHWNAVKTDPYAAIIDLENKVHNTKLYEMLHGTKYAVYWAVVKDAAALEKRINAKYKDKMRLYIEKNTNWRISRETTLLPTIQLIFGELYVNLKYGSQLIRIKFQEIEKM